MKTYIITVAIIFFIDIIGKALVLKDHDLEREPKVVVFDLVVNLGLLVWGSMLIAESV